MGDIFGSIGGLIGTGFAVAGSIMSSDQARDQAKYFNQMIGKINENYNFQKNIVKRGQKMEQAQQTQGFIDAGIETNQGSSQTVDKSMQNLQQVQGEQIQQMDFEHEMQIMGLQRQVKNSENMANNYMMAGIGAGISGILSSAGSFSGYNGGKKS